MKRWFLLTIILYLAILVLLSMPVLMLAAWPHVPPHEATFIFLEPAFWVGIGVLGAAQTLLLLVPIASARNRPKARRKLLIPVITSAFFMALLFLSGATCVLLAGWGDHSDRLFGGLFQGVNGDMNFMISLALAILLCWIFWGAMFYRFRRSTDPDLLTNRLMRWLLAGSILELLVAVPSHVIVRQRGDCCAPIGTFWGIVCGLSVMLLSFGPGVFFLFARRMDLLRNRPKGQCQKCSYDLRAHHPGDRCPECGTPIPQSEPRA